MPTLPVAPGQRRQMGDDLAGVFLFARRYSRRDRRGIAEPLISMRAAGDAMTGEPRVDVDVAPLTVPSQAAIGHHFDNDRHFRVGCAGATRWRRYGCRRQRDPERIDGFDSKGELGPYHGRYSLNRLVERSYKRRFKAQSRFAFFEANTPINENGRARTGAPFTTIGLRVSPKAQPACDGGFRAFENRLAVASAEILAQGPASYSRRKSPRAPAVPAHTFSAEVVQAGRKIGNMTLKPSSLRSKPSFLHLVGRWFAALPRRQAGIAAEPLRQLAYRQIFLPGPVR